jgi:FdhD protein
MTEGDRPTARRRVCAVHQTQNAEQEIEVVLEEPLALHLNGQQVAVLMRLPGQEKELAAGFCLSEGLVSDFSGVLTIHHCGQGLPVPGEEAGAEDGISRNRVEVRAREDALRPDARLEVVRLIRAGCGAVDVARNALSLAPVEAALRVEAAVFWGLGPALRAAQSLHAEVGGVHAAGIFTAEGQLVVACEDIGRHNAVDKALGYCLLRGIPLADKILLSSGRLSYEMVAKVVRLGLPILASVSAPTALAVALAEQFNVTLVGYLRGQKMTLYAHPERIILP